MVVDSILPHAECGPNDHRKDAPPFTVNSDRSVSFDADLSKDEQKVKSYQNQIEEINIDGMLEKDENEVLYGRAGYLSGGFQNLMLDFILGRHVALTGTSAKNSLDIIL